MWRWIGWGLALVTLLFFFPITRRLMIAILPLGRGVDDLIFFVAAGLLVVYLAVTRGALPLVRRRRTRPSREERIKALERELDLDNES